MARPLLVLLVCSLFIGLFLETIPAGAREIIAGPALDQPGKGLRIGLLWWPADPANPANPFIESLEECLTGQLAAACPDTVLVTSGAIRETLFPLLEPATQPESETALAELLNRADVRTRLAKRMDLLVTFTGGTAKEEKGGILCGAGYGGGGCLGLAWINQDTRIGVVIWDLAQTLPAARQSSRVEGTTWIPAFILPVPIPAFTEAAACRDIKQQIFDFIYSSHRDRYCR